MLVLLHFCGAAPETKALNFTKLRCVEPSLAEFTYVTLWFAGKSRPMLKKKSPVARSSAFPQLLWVVPCAQALFA